jgi:hypothetical protein
VEKIPVNYLAYSFPLGHLTRGTATTRKYKVLPECVIVLFTTQRTWCCLLNNWYTTCFNLFFSWENEYANTWKCDAQVVSTGPNPEWDESFSWSFESPPKGQKLHISCKNKSKMGKVTWTNNKRLYSCYFVHTFPLNPSNFLSDDRVHLGKWQSRLIGWWCWGQYPESTLCCRKVKVAPREI